MYKWYNKTEKIIHYPNCSTTEFSYLQNEDDVYTYQGREYENISIDEITQHSENAFKILRSSLRTTTQGFKPTMLLTGNPGGVGHLWVKRIFVDRLFKDNENTTDFDFIRSKVTDNLALMRSDPLYVKRLEDLPDYLRKAYLEGDWNIFAGQAFDELSESVHVINPFELGVNTRYFAGYDHGYNHPFAYTLWALTTDGSIYCIGKITNRLKNIEQIVSMIKQLNGEREVDMYAGHDIFSKQKDGTPSVFEQFFEYGITMLKANIHREFGVAFMRKLFTKKGKEPTVKFFRNTIEVFNNIASMQYSPNKPEDVLKMDADENGEGGDDFYDSSRYALTSRAQPIEPKVKENPFSGEHILKQLQEIKDREVNSYDSYYS